MMLLEQFTRFTLNWVQDLMNLVIKRGCNSNLKSKEYHSYENNHSIPATMERKCKLYFALIFYAKKTSLLNVSLWVN